VSARSCFSPPATNVGIATGVKNDAGTAHGIDSFGLIRPFRRSRRGIATAATRGDAAAFSSTGLSPTEHTSAGNSASPCIDTMLQPADHRPPLNVAVTADIPAKVHCA
jgi:hypothetical protein